MVSDMITKIVQALASAPFPGGGGAVEGAGVQFPLTTYQTNAAV